MGLTPSQLEAVEVQETERDTCVVAGPGSGKTTVLVEYFQRLVESGRDPLRILAITFTDKAANNMRERLALVFQDRPKIRGSLERAYVSTVHGFCMRLLKENAIFAGIDPDFYVMDERESARAQRLAVDEVLDQMFAEEPQRMLALMRGLSAADTGAALLDAYEAVRAAGVGISDLGRFPRPAGVGLPEVAAAVERLDRERPRWTFDQLSHLDEVRESAHRILDAATGDTGAALRALAAFECKLTRLKRGNSTYDAVRELSKELIPELEYALITDYYACDRATVLELLARFDRAYRERKQQAGGLDYDDLEEYAVQLLEENGEVRRQVQAQFEQVLMDEFQDTNGRQAKLLKLVRAPERFYAVGDINQSIYGFRHAEPEVFQEYRGEVGKAGDRLVELVENFRSRAEILRSVEALVEGAEGIEKRPLIPGVEFPAKDTPSVEVFAATADDADRALGFEAQWTAARILELEGQLQLRVREGGTRTAEFRDFAVLVRNSEVLAEFTRTFDDLGIPYVVSRGKGFYETREVVDLLRLLRVILNPRDEISMAAVLRSPFAYVSDESLLRLKLTGNLGAAVEQLTAEALAPFAPDDAAKLTRFREQLAAWRKSRDYTGIDSLLMRAMDECGYECPSGPRGAANVEKFLALARAAGSRQSLSEFVEEMELLRASKPREADAPPEDSANAVKLMTVHSAKGLEFPIVFLAAMHKGVDSGPGGISFSPRIGLGARWKHPASRDDKDDLFQHAIREEMKKREQDEANRLLYVAMTRAEEHLVLSFSGNGKKVQNWAARVKESLHLDLEVPCDRTATLLSPRGELATIRVRCVNAPPPAPSRATRQEAEAEARLLERPVVNEQYDSQANVTSIVLFAECPRRYYISRYLGLEEKSHPSQEHDHDIDTGLSASDFGRQVHTLLAGGTVESPDPEAVRMAEVFRKSELGRRSAAASVVQREFDFLMEIEDLVLRGQIDLWFEENGRTVLVDYKTDRVNAAGAQARAERYALQLRLYAQALDRLNGRMSDEAYISFLQPNVAIRVDLRPNLFDAPETAVREFREAQEQSRFPLIEGEHCVRCPHFQGLCPATGPLQ